MNKKLTTIGPWVFKSHKSLLVDASFFILVFLYLGLHVLTYFLFFSLDDNINSQVAHRTIELAIVQGKEDLLSEWAEENKDVLSLTSTSRLVGNQHIYVLVTSDYQNRQRVIDSVPDGVGQFSIAHHIMDIQYHKITFQKTVMKVVSVVLWIIFSIIYLVSFYEYTAEQKKNVGHLRYLGFKSSTMYLMIITSSIKHMTWKMVLAIVAYPLLMHPLIVYLIDLTSLNPFIVSYRIGMWNCCIILLGFTVSTMILSCISLKIIIVKGSK